MGCQSLQLFLLIGPDHDAVAVAAECPGGVLDGFAAPDLGVGSGKIHGMSAQLEHPGFKGCPGPGGVFCENHGKGFACQPVMTNAMTHVIFQLIRQIENFKDILGGEIQKLQ